jgi:hypothetical protein
LAELRPDCECDAEDFQVAVNGLAFVPDGYIIYPETRELHFFEVEVTSPMSKEKLESYGAFVGTMHTYWVDFEVYTVNQHGHINRVDLLLHYGDWLLKRRAEAAQA